MNNRQLLVKDQKPMTQAPDWNAYLTQVGETKDKAAFAALFGHFSPLLKSFLMKGSNVSSESAEELVQETMIKVWQRSATFSAAHASASTWIYTIARNTRIDAFRKQSRQDPQTLKAEDIYESNEEDTPYATLVDFRRTGHIGKHLNELPEEQSAVLRMMYFQGMSGQQVADAMDIPLGTVKSRIRLALVKLQIGLAPSYKLDSDDEGSSHDK